MKKFETKLPTTYTALCTKIVDNSLFSRSFKSLALLVSLWCLGSISQVFAQTNYSIDELKALSQQEHHTLPPLNLDQAALFDKARQFEAQSKGQLDNALSPLLDAKPSADAKGVMVFVSLGMPATSLQQLLMQSADLQVPLIVRGVLPQGFTATVKQMNHLIDNKGKTIQSGFAINPQWFTQFGITQVPAFVAVRPNKCQAKQPCSTDDFDVIYGNVSLYDALNLLAQHGSIPDVAAKTLAKGAK
ncbi:MULTISPECIES: type-F conjugative transfer system pilin assembly protein TrbC [unclassified Shewanella]|uniref:type-F conjugative transfer system pilin assembly protein TrbC n=1 Tax=unclassified Shewanella TaxID=196818 RepID=UPI0021D93679|nr:MULTISPECIES: type-F conjugative transfer system pilin assembly protein TrbC [unclassified Shewanella]MCU8036398.1 type-F conjugative transfer system pilin assembly protein TrbC [Shewanella sp. SM71]MCU8098344.1 type-F conjugative transfer system pilin assembly protein TrbC [Shewanella sp. SM102]